MSRRGAIAIACCLAALMATGGVAMALEAPVLLLQIDETAVPPVSDAPALPTGVTIGSDVTPCGSGGCWRELALLSPGDLPPTDLVRDLGLQHETCAARSLVDWRHVCTGAHVVGGRVIVYLAFDRWG